jgi:hypothetical protein
MAVQSNEVDEAEAAGIIFAAYISGEMCFNERGRRNETHPHKQGPRSTPRQLMSFAATTVNGIRA